MIERCHKRGCVGFRVYLVVFCAIGCSIGIEYNDNASIRHQNFSPAALRSASAVQEGKLAMTQCPASSQCSTTSNAVGTDC
jgi:hypothetical protein